AAGRTEFFCNDHFDHSDSHCRLPVSDCGRVAAERKERRPRRGFRRTGQPDSVRPAGRSFGSFPGDDLVRDHLHAHVDHAFDFCGAANWTHVRAFGSQAVADEVAASDSRRAFRTSDGSAKPGADTEIEIQTADNSCSAPQSPSAAEADLCSGAFTARLKSCPSQNLRESEFLSGPIEIEIRRGSPDYPTRKGFSSLSSPMVVRGPWPGMTTVSSGRVRTRSCRERMIFSKDPPGKSGQTLPSVWPGVWRTFAVRLPVRNDSPSAMLASMATSPGAAMPSQDACTSSIFSSA